MPKRPIRRIRKSHDPALLEKLHAKTSALSENRMNAKSRKDMFRKTSTDEDSSNITNIMETIQKLEPSLVSNDKNKKKVETVVRMIVSHGLNKTLKALNINDSTLKSTMKSLFGNMLSKSEAPARSQSVEYVTPTEKPTGEDVTEPVCANDDTGYESGDIQDDEWKSIKTVTRRVIRPRVP